MSLVPSGVIPHLYHLGQIQGLIEQKDRKIQFLSAQNDQMLKALAKIRVDLERALKDGTKMEEAVTASVNLARSLTPYSNDWGVTHTYDPPLAKPTLADPA